MPDRYTDEELRERGWTIERADDGSKWGYHAEFEENCGGDVTLGVPVHIREIVVHERRLDAAHNAAIEAAAKMIVDGMPRMAGLRDALEAAILRLKRPERT